MNRLFKAPLEVFQWNGECKVRDAEKKTVFSLSIETREYQKVNTFRGELMPLIVRLLNEWAKGEEVMEGLRVDYKAPQSTPEAQESPTVASEPQDGTNGHEVKRRGNPNWIKGKKQK